MKSIFSLLASFILVCAPPAHASFVNLKAGLIPFFLRGGHFEMDVGVSERWSLGLGVLNVKTEVTDPNFYGPLLVSPTILTLRGTFSLNGTFSSGLYLSPSLQSASVRATGLSQLERPITATATASSVQGVVGYHWFGEHLNFGLGIGATLPLSMSVLDVDDGVTRWTQELPRASGPTVAFEAFLGWTF